MGTNAQICFQTSEHASTKKKNYKNKLAARTMANRFGTV